MRQTATSAHFSDRVEKDIGGGGELPKYYYDSYDPFVSLAAAAAVTKTIKLATGICLVVERDPIHTAKEVSTVDQLSSGRFILALAGVGTRRRWPITALRLQPASS